MSRLSLIEELPNELLLSIFERLPTLSLVGLTLVSHRIHAVATEALKLRLLATAHLGRHEILLECYHPVAKVTTPSLACHARSIRPLGSSPPPSPSQSPLGSSLRPLESADWGLADLGSLYSHFQLEVTDTHGASGAADADADADADAGRRAPKPTHRVFMDDADWFSQLCASTSIVRQGPRPGIFLSHQAIGEGVVRVWRDWAAEAAERSASGTTGGAAAEGLDVLWADVHQTVGLRFTVQKTDTETALEEWGHILVSTENPPVEYILHYEELLVRTTKILLAMDKLAVQEVANSGKAIVIASYQV
ncbi:hypothetical protein SODALDRAFT_29373 [Sodiomyces alkalinus F11]|uniref:F-box domain-containing protein n=1 Tax=Sodiomyces alkalinus (strain CBS 110278 / VKM F-3762 / F11) TaxID=1314773 RepID=A0A3N2Q8F4_SODAK|nr:hypothetical protein SODALDRAFT_29373 [Sodiomyces alkalinus F11]ROT43053.1 hypothetical protein SODALDRAFT_29373 [Sodiomyces alkalinus F11]